MKKLILGTLLCLFAVSAQAVEFTTPTWGNATCDVGDPNDFDTCELSFPAIYSDTLISINNVGDLNYHDGDGAITYSLDVRVDGIWVSIYSDVPLDGASRPVSSNIVTPITFTGGVVDGIRFAVDTPINQAYHNGENSMTFTLDGQVSPVPTLSEYSLILLIMLLAGIGIYSQRRQSRDIG